MTLDDIRARYPHPITTDDIIEILETPFCYCIGGAVLLAYDLSSPAQTCFPSVGALADGLQAINRALGHTTALAFARRIISANDDSRFDEAWAAVGETLEYGTKE